MRGLFALEHVIVLEGEGLVFFLYDELLTRYLGGGADVVELRKVDVHGPFLAQARLLGEIGRLRFDGLEQVLGGEFALECVGVCVGIAQDAFAGFEQLGDQGMGYSRLS